MSEQIKKIWQRANRYQYEDGMVEIGTGILFIVIAFGQMIIHAAIEQGSPVWIILTSIGMVALIAGGTILVQIVVTRLKNIVTYPRTGYVEINRENKRGRAMLIAFSVAFALSMLFSADTKLDWINHMGFVNGIFLTALLIFLGYQSMIQRFYLVAIAPFIGAIILPIVDFPDVLSSAIVFGLAGFGLLISGLLGMNHFIAQNPVQSNEDE